MRIVAVSVVKNEVDIIEAFVRHAAALVDHHIILDHRSTDGTAGLLSQLQAEGLPLTLHHDDRVSLDQSMRTAALFRRAVRDFQADWVLPLDADEFPQAVSPAAFRAVLAGSAEPLQYRLIDYAPHPDDAADETNPVLRLQHRTLESTPVYKVIAPAALAADPRVTPETGNHSLFRDFATAIPARRDEAIWLAHYSVRTAAQCVTKIVQHECQRLIGGYPAGCASHYRSHFERLAGSPRSILADAGAYLRGAVERPASYWGTPLRSQSPLTDWERTAACLTPFIGQIATDYGRLAAELAALRNRKPSRIARLWQRLTKRRVPVQSPEAIAAAAMQDGVRRVDSRTAAALGCELAIVQTTESPTSIDITLRGQNVGLATWLCRTPDVVGQVNVGVRLVAADGRALNPDFHRQAIPRNIEPGETVTLSFAVPRPDAGSTLAFDMVSEGVAWFGYPSCRLPVIAAASRAA